MHEQYDEDDNPENYSTRERSGGWKRCDNCQRKIRERRVVHNWNGKDWQLLKCECGNKWKVEDI